VDNALQIDEIHKYQYHLSQILGREIDEDTAAWIWIRKYAESWRLMHPRKTPEDFYIAA